MEMNSRTRVRFMIISAALFLAVTTAFAQNPPPAPQTAGAPAPQQGRGATVGQIPIPQPCTPEQIAAAQAAANQPADAAGGRGRGGRGGGVPCQMTDPREGLKPGKYDAIIPSLPKMPASDPSYQERVEAAKADITNKDAVAMATEYVRLRKVKDIINADLSAVQLLITAHEQLLDISQEAQSAGWGDYGVKDNSVKLPTGEAVRIQREPAGKVVDEEAFRLWGIANGYERQMKLHHGTMNGIVKERALAGEPGPDGTETYAYTKVVFVKKGAE